MRTILLASALTFALGGTAFAQMCGGGIQQSTTAESSAMPGKGGMGCMGMQRTQVDDDPMADKPVATPNKPVTGGMMMCPCCRNMASMGGGMMGGQKVDGDKPPPAGESGRRRDHQYVLQA
jgi:hypothetical protein